MIIKKCINVKITHMFTLLGGVLGFASSAFPEILSMFKNKQSNKHQLAIIEKQIAIQQSKAQINLEALNSKADIAESKALYSHAAQLSSTPWVNALQSSVRPVITYAFFLLFTTVKISSLYVLTHANDIAIESAIIEIWDLETQSLFSAVMAFWFGQRALLKLRAAPK